MRIISGTLRGKKLLTPSNDLIRPTSDKARESIYNILHNTLETPLPECQILDIFSGTGAFGLEGASRGAKSVTFVDKDLTLTQKNATLCKFSNLKFIKKDATKLGTAPCQYDLIFMDAPYKQNLSEPVLINLIRNHWCHQTTLIIVETAKDEELNIPDELSIIDERTYGIAKFHFLNLK